MDGGIPAFITRRTLAAWAQPCFKVTNCDLKVREPLNNSMQGEAEFSPMSWGH